MNASKLEPQRTGAAVTLIRSYRFVAASARAHRYGTHLSGVWFRLTAPKGGVRKGLKNFETHLSEAELALLLAVAFEQGRKSSKK